MISKNPTANKLRQTLGHLALGAISLFAATSMAMAQEPQSAAQQRYQQDMAACTGGQSSQDAATCQREARNALAEASRGGLSSAPDASTNAVQRCDVFSGDERTVCEARLRGGTAQVQGSVEGGGILRETVTPIPAK